MFPVFGMTTSDLMVDQSDSEITMSLWMGNGTLYQCDFGAVKAGTTYFCEEGLLQALCEFEELLDCSDVMAHEEIGGVCDAFDDYKLVIEVTGGSDTVVIDEVAFFLWNDSGNTTNLFDGVYGNSNDAWCIDDGEEPTCSLNQDDWEYSDNECSSGQTAWNLTCIGGDCSSDRMVFHFNTDAPDEMYAQWEDATGICVLPETEDCSCGMPSTFCSLMSECPVNRSSHRET